MGVLLNLKEYTKKRDYYEVGQTIIVDIWFEHITAKIEKIIYNEDNIQISIKKAHKKIKDKCVFHLSDDLIVSGASIVEKNKK